MLPGMTHVALTLLVLVSSFWEGKTENKQIHHYEVSNFLYVYNSVKKKRIKEFK